MPAFAGGLLLAALLLLPNKAQAAADVTSTFTLDGVRTTVSSPFMPAPTFTVAKPGAVDQTAVSSWVDPYRDLTLETMPFGTTSSGDDLPVAARGEAPAYRADLRSQRHAEGGAPQAAPSIDLFGATTPGTLSQVRLAVSTSGKVPVAVAEWVSQAGSRLWILRAAERLTATDTMSSFSARVVGITVTSADISAPPPPSPSPSPSPTVTTAPSPSPSPSTSPSPSASPSPRPSPSPSAPPSPASAPASSPSPPQAVTDSVRVGVQTQATAGTNAPWWSGVCDVGHNGDGFPLGAVFQGFAACGPRPIFESPPDSTDYQVQFFPGAWGEFEFECVELTMRYMYLMYGIDPYPANGNQVVTNYSGTRMVKVANGTVGQAPQPGDILSFGADTADGHAAVVTASAVDSSGNGSVTVIEENNSATGTSTLSVSGWVVGPDAYPTIGWLHSVGSDGPAVTVSPSTGQQFVLWQAGNGGLWEDRGARPMWDGPTALSDGVLGSGAAAGVRSNGEEDVFWRGTNGDLWEAHSPGGTAAWTGPVDVGHGWDLDSAPSVAVNQSNNQEYVFWQGPGGGLWEGFWTGSEWVGPISLPMGVLGSAPSAGVTASGQEDVFWRGTNGDLWEGFWANSRWNGPVDVGRDWNLGSAPSVGVGQGEGYQYVFWQGHDGRLWEGLWNGVRWTGPTALRMGALGSAPTAGVEKDGEVDVFWRGGNGDLWEGFTSGGTWQGPFDQGHGWALTGAPSVGVNQSNGQQDVFWQGPGGGLRTGFWNAAVWSGPSSLSMGTLGSAPTAGITASGELDVFWAGTNADVWAGVSSAAGIWTGPFDRGSGWAIGSNPSVTVNESNGQETLFWLGSDGGLWTGHGSGGSWTGPSSLGMGQLGSPPAAGEHPSGELDVFWRGTTGALWEAFSVGGRWSGPFAVGPGWNLASQPAVTVNQTTGEEDVFWRGSDGGLWEGFWNGVRWNGPISIGMGQLASAPGAGTEPDGQEVVFWRATDGDLTEALWTGLLWEGPFDMGAAWTL